MRPGSLYRGLDCKSQDTGRDASRSARVKCGSRPRRRQRCSWQLAIPIAHFCTAGPPRRGEQVRRLRAWQLRSSCRAARELSCGDPLAQRFLAALDLVFRLLLVMRVPVATPRSGPLTRMGALSQMSSRVARREASRLYGARAAPRIVEDVLLFTPSLSMWMCPPSARRVADRRVAPAFQDCCDLRASCSDGVIRDSTWGKQIARFRNPLAVGSP